VSTYSAPTSAAQESVPWTIDTLDGRLTHAVSAFDPNHGGAVAIWTAHAALGSAGSEVHWYEIDPAHQALFQSGIVSSTTRFYFNPSIAPDRAVTPTSSAYGANMAMTVTFSGPVDFPSVGLVTKVGSAAQSVVSTIQTSAGAYSDFSCLESVGFERTTCRWGDYAGAVPDPAAALGGPGGMVWLSNEYDTGAVSTLATWLTWDFSANPAG
jgi:hypothetical protein